MSLVMPIVLLVKKWSVSEILQLVKNYLSYLKRKGKGKRIIDRLLNLLDLHSLKLLIYKGFVVLSDCVPVVKLFNFYNLVHFYRLCSLYSVRAQTVQPLQGGRSPQGGCGYIYTMLYILRRFRVCTRLGRGFKDYTGKGLGEDILFPPLLKREMQRGSLEWLYNPEGLISIIASDSQSVKYFRTFL